MKRNLYVKSLLIALALCVSTFVSAAPRINGTWVGNANKVTTSSCNVRVPIVLTINQCGFSGSVFNGTAKVGSTTIAARQESSSPQKR